MEFFEYALAKESVVTLYSDKSYSSGLISQMLYGESLVVLEVSGDWIRVKTVFDDTIGWVSRNQLKTVSETYLGDRKVEVLSEPCVFKEVEQGGMLLSLGSEIEDLKQIELEGDLRYRIAAIAKKFVNVPFLKGGRSFFGVDNSSFVQLVFKASGIKLPLDPEIQSQMGDTLSFVEECQVGDLAFFENSEGMINHVGIMLENLRIIHCFGKVRIDQLDSLGIYNIEEKKHSHKLRFIRSLLS